MEIALPAELQEQVSSACAAVELHLAGTLLGIHLFGSAVDGGLRPHSDIDLLVTVQTHLHEPIREALLCDLLRISALPGSHDARRPLEVTVVAYPEVVPWRYPGRRELQFGEWLREDLQDGIVEPAVVDPDLAVLLRMVRRRSVALLGPEACRLFDPVPEVDFLRALHDTVAQWRSPVDWQGDERNVILALARIWHSASTGGIAPKDVAAAWARERSPAQLRPLLDEARAGYLGLATDRLAVRDREIVAYVSFVKSMIAAGPASS
jgi:streptomycin 3"-adenylyltransferase